jgi:hypothetical protein
MQQRNCFRREIRGIMNNKSRRENDFVEKVKDVGRMEDKGMPSLVAPTNSYKRVCRIISL